MYTLLFIAVTAPVYLGTFSNLDTCHSAIRELLVTKLNPPNQRLPQVDVAVDNILKFQKEYICVKNGN